MGKEQSPRSGTSQKEDSEEPDSYFINGDSLCQRAKQVIKETLMVNCIDVLNLL